MISQNVFYFHLRLRLAFGFWNAYTKQYYNIKFGKKVLLALQYGIW